VGELHAKEHVITHQRLAWHADEDSCLFLLLLLSGKGTKRESLLYICRRSLVKLDGEKAKG
jgi:hypothetical protein